MTHVKIEKNGSFISSIEIKGHALSGKYNHDIVCAGISTIVFGICNALDELSLYDTTQIIFKDDVVRIPNIIEDEKTQLILKTMIVELQTVEQSYSQYIEISF